MAKDKKKIVLNKTKEGKHVNIFLIFNGEVEWVSRIIIKGYLNLVRTVLCHIGELGKIGYSANFFGASSQAEQKGYYG